MKFLSLDPSKNHVGYCTFATVANPKPGKPPSFKWEFGTWHLQGHSLTQRCHDLFEHIAEEITPIDHLIMEYPAFYSSEKGQIAAHQNYTINLAFICGYIAGHLKRDHRTYHPITATTWKGMVGKEITARKFFYCFKGLKRGELDEHAIDAAMMLRYFLKCYGAELFRVAGEAFPECPELQF